MGKAVSLNKLTASSRFVLEASVRREATGHDEVTSTAGETVRAFVPAPLPPEPPVGLVGSLQALHERALLACGRLDGVWSLLPDPELVLHAYVRREALLPSQIEGTQSSLADLLLFELEEAPGVPLDDVVEVSSYVAGLEHGLTSLAEGFPLSSGLLREIHGRLLARGRGVARTGSVAPAQATRASCRRRRGWWRAAWASWSSSSTATTTVSTPCRYWFAPPWPTCSLKRAWPMRPCAGGRSPVQSCSRSEAA